MSFLARNRALHLAAATLSAVAAMFDGGARERTPAELRTAATAAYSPPPGGFNCILTSRTIGPWGGRIGPLRDGALRITIVIPRYTFPVPVQLTITEAYSRYRPCLGVSVARLRGFRLFGGVGIEVTLGESPYGLFPHRIRLRIRRINVPVRVGGSRRSRSNGGVTVIAGRRHDGTSQHRGVNVRGTRGVRRGPEAPPRQHDVETARRSRHRGDRAADRGAAAWRLWLPGLGVLAAGDSGVLLSASMQAPGHRNDWTARAC